MLIYVANISKNKTFFKMIKHTKIIINDNVDDYGLETPLKAGFPPSETMHVSARLSMRSSYIYLFENTLYKNTIRISKN